MQIIHEFAPSKENPRNSEGAFYRKPDGTIGFIYSRFTNGSEDFARSDLVEAVFSGDGKTYLGRERVIFTSEDFGAQNIMCPSVQRMPDGRLVLVFDVRMGPGHLTPWVFESFDGGNTFVNGCNTLPESRYVGTENDRLVLTRDGNLILWCFESPRQEGAYAGIGSQTQIVPLFSEDGGKSFIELDHYKMEPELYCGLQEPGTVELNDGTLFTWARSTGGCQYVSHSADGGRTYEKFVPSPVFTSPLSPMSVKKLADGRLIAVYNPIPPTKEMVEQNKGILWSRRSPLVYRVFDGESWSEPGELEPFSETTNYCYTAIFAEKDFVLLGYCASDTVRDGGGLNRLRVTRLEMSEL